MSLVLSILVGLATLAFISAPWWRRDPVAHAAQGQSLEAAPAEHSTLLERRDALLRDLKDLEFDHRMGKIDTDDFEQMRVGTAAAASAVLQEIEAGKRSGESRRSGKGARGRGAATRPANNAVAEAEMLIAQARRSKGTNRNGFDAEAEILVARARNRSRSPIEAAAPAKAAPAKQAKEWCCASCGRVMADADRFCGSCGAARPAEPDN